METSYNGWPASKTASAIGINAAAVARGTKVKFPGGVKHGDVEFLLMYVAGEIHRHVQALGTGCWGYAYRMNRNAANLSCHASGTAIDVNAPLHPNGKRGTWTAAQVKTIRAILAMCGGVVKWGEDFGGTCDGMHFEIHGDEAAVHKAANVLRAKLAAPKPVTKPVPSWFKRTLAEGSKGADVKTCQEHLHMANADGIFGPKTRAAVVTIQRKYGLPVTGAVNSSTAKVIG